MDVLQRIVVGYVGLERLLHEVSCCISVIDAEAKALPDFCL